MWRARDEVLGRAVAVKVLTGSADPERIRDEARNAAALSHPNLAQVFDYGESGSTPYVVMELIAGETLERRLVAGPVPPDEAFRLCAEVAAGLAAAHDAGLVHRDVKPANIMVTTTGAKLVDFGIAAPAGAGEERVLGTPAYVAPERIMGGAVTPASDVYALGVVLYKLLAGVLPWPGETTTGIVRDHVHTPPSPLPDQPGVPRPIAALCMSCLAKDPANRPPARFVADTLARAAARAVLGEPPAGTPRWRLAMAAAAVAVMAGAWLYSGVSPLRDSTGLPAQGPEVASSSSSPSSSAVPVPGSSTVTVVATASNLPRQSGGAPPATAPPPPPSVSTAPSASAAPPVTFTSDGGTATARCADGRAQLTGWEAARSYTVETATPGPAATATVTFRHGNDLVDIAVTCAGGTPRAEVTTRKR
ncbi:serine/threonine-protein kinase [Dactylosporangium sp. AC04546]|uniref:serine/threonine-protein kinase n=1 Tax=Dactylosporangium sp. AC04546 TaxID=2862460 RepID=UPI002E7BBAD2|nr:serine/threonine-protein kinase [Dactylosporangium sp. AC04546]WVK87961.1 serine/threonine-protein kinase [Dactylosporangium sp. AC04546]